MTKYIIDYDSTFLKIESLDVLANIAMDNLANKKEILDKITYITNKAMNGEITFTSSLKQRMALLKANKSDIVLCINELKKQVSNSFLKNKNFLKKNNDNIYIVSNGMRNLIEPVVCEYGIKSSHIFANDFVFNSNEVCGVDENNILTKDNGKPNVVKALGFSFSDIVVIGDGITDYSIKKAGYAKYFYAYCENIKRQAVCEKADKIVYSLDEVLKLHDDFVN
jgi:D-3-phosphoglycerate dehydrogenase